MAKDVIKWWQREQYHYDLICPDYSSQDLYLFDTKGGMNVKSISLKVEKCSNDSKSSSHECKDSDEIEEFIKDLTLQVYLLESSIDMRQLHHQNNQLHQKFVSEHDISLDKYTEQWIFLH